MNNLFYFINISLDELKTHSLHEKKLYVVFVNFTVCCNAIKLQAAIIFFNFEEKLQEGDNAYFLLKRGQLFEDVGEASNIFVMSMDSLFKLSDLTSTKCIQ